MIQLVNDEELVSLGENECEWERNEEEGEGVRGWKREEKLRGCMI